MIRIDSLQKRFGAITALDDVTLNIEPGAITAIAGPNGSGKTTLIKSILGLVKPDAGRIEIGGELMNGHPSYRRRIGYMPQTGHFPENLKISEVLQLVQSIREEPADPRSGLLEEFGLKSEMSKRIRTLSGGTRQKLGATIAFLFPGDILILDEPTAGLDPVASGVLKRAILRRRDNGTTVILTTHIISEIESLAENVVFLCDGKLKYAGTRTALTDQTGESDLESSFAILMREAQ